MLAINICLLLWIGTIVLNIYIYAVAVQPEEFVGGRKTCVNPFGAILANEKDVFVREKWNALVLDTLYALKIYCELWLIGKHCEGKTYKFKIWCYCEQRFAFK